MTMHAVGIDIGGTKIAAAVVDASGKIVTRYASRGHAGRLPDEVVESAEAAFDRVLNEAGLGSKDVAGIGVGFAGHVWGERGLVLTSSNLPAWNRHPLRDHLQDRIGVRVLLENDTNCAAWGEYRFGAGRGSRYLCYVTMSTGFGIGIVIDGKLYAGATGTAGELGHTVANPDGPLCTCGKRGCLMSYACGMAISRMAWERVQSGEPTLLRELAGEFSPDETVACHAFSGEVVARAAALGDRPAQEILAVAARYFGIGLSTVVQVVNPDRIVIGGGLAEIGPMLLEPCIQALKENVHSVIADSADIVRSQLGGDAELAGAADLVWGL